MFPIAERILAGAVLVDGGVVAVGALVVAIAHEFAFVFESKEDLTQLVFIWVDPGKSIG